MASSEISTLTTNLTRPKTSATLTVRVIKSFEYRTEKSLVLHNINLETTTVGQLKEIARQGTKLATHLEGRELEHHSFSVQLYNLSQAGNRIETYLSVRPFSFLDLIHLTILQTH